jgi:hypothetical protein
MPSPTALLSKLLIIELLLLLHLSVELSLLHRLLIAHHQSDLANLFSLHSKTLNELLSRLLVATESAETHSIVEGLSTCYAECHGLT